MLKNETGYLVRFIGLYFYLLAEDFWRKPFVSLVLAFVAASLVSKK
jgi:hypothetical protein